MNFVFLGAPQPLTKAYAKDAVGTITKTSYPHAYEFTSYAEHCPDLITLAAAMNKHAALNHCMLKGEITKPLTAQSRAGSTTSSSVTHWLCFDIDGLPETVTYTTSDNLSVTAPFTVEDFMRLIGLGDVSYILQWSASYGIESKALRCHVVVMLKIPVSAPLIKQWLINLNHTVDRLRENQGLTKTGNSLTWPLDITACQNDKLIYIAPPQLKGIKNPLGKTPRISVIKKKDDTFVFPIATSTAKNRALTDTRILELRAAAGLPPRKLNYKVVGGNEVLVKPDSCDATEIKQERGFVYFNINGGDSWGYYHPEDNPDYIFNFKGEPTYLTKELLPDYWKSLQSAGHRQDSSGLTYLAFSDSQTGTYWKGTYDAANDILDILPAKTLIILEHFAKQHGVIIGDYVPEWTMTFDPHDSVRVDFGNRIINTFQLTQYMKAVAKKVMVCPPTIFRVIHHALGGDVEITGHFINWVAFILQERDRTLTSWVLHGIEGTGKGILVDRILRPLFGITQTTVRRMEEFKQPYNGYMRQCFIVAIDEVQTSALLDESGVAANMRNFITEPTITVRNMYSPPVECRNYTNWIYLSNKPDPVSVPKNDRRTNVAKYQPVKFYPTDADLAKWPADKLAIEKELQAFHDYLLGYAVDKAAAGTPMDTDDRNTLISISENAIDSVAGALLDGHMEFFLDQLPTGEQYRTNLVNLNKIEDYKKTLFDILARTDALTGKVNIPRDELRTIFEYTVGKIPESPNKFTSLLKHHRIHVKKVWGDGKTVNGISCEFKDVAQFGAYLSTHYPAAKKAAKAKP